MISNGPLIGRENVGLSAHHTALLNYLDLLSLRFTFEVDVDSNASVEHLPGKHVAIVREIDRIIASVQAAVKAILEVYPKQIDAHTVSAKYCIPPQLTSIWQNDARNAYILSTCASRLQEAARTTPFDYSKAIAIIRWFSGLLEEAGAVFSGVSRSVCRLQEMLSLSSGFGLVEIWESLHIGVPRDILSDLQRFGQLAHAIKDRSKFEGECGSPSVDFQSLTVSEAVRRQILDTMSVALVQQPDFVARYQELRSKLESVCSADPLHWASTHLNRIPVPFSGCRS